MEKLTAEELETWKTEPSDSPKKIAIARKVKDRQMLRREQSSDLTQEMSIANR